MNKVEENMLTTVITLSLIGTIIRLILRKIRL
jgi:hypothetical protein